MPNIININSIISANPNFVHSNVIPIATNIEYLSALPASSVQIRVIKKVINPAIITPITIILSVFLFLYIY